MLPLLRFTLMLITGFLLVVLKDSPGFRQRLDHTAKWEQMAGIINVKWLLLRFSMRMDTSLHSL